MKHTNENIDLMFLQYERREFMLEKHQRKFMKSIKKYFKLNKHLSTGQFKWLEIYWSIYTGCGDLEPEPGER